MSKFARSWALMKASGDVLRQDKELMMFPLFSGIAAILITISFALPLVAVNAFDQIDSSQESQVGLLAVAFLFYLTLYFVVFFFNAALVGAAMIRLDGGDPTVADGLRIARSKFLPILGYAAITATVGMILRAIEERAGFIGKWIAGLLGVAFTAATFLTVPLLVTRDIGPVAAVKESATLLKQTWGENIIGNGGMGIAFFLLYAALAVVGVAAVIAAATMESGALVLTVVACVVFAAIALMLIHASLQGVYSAALYRYATSGEGGAAFEAALLGNAFRPRAR